MWRGRGSRSGEEAGRGRVWRARDGPRTEQARDPREHGRQLQGVGVAEHRIEREQARRPEARHRKRAEGAPGRRSRATPAPIWDGELAVGRACHVTSRIVQPAYRCSGERSRTSPRRATGASRLNARERASPRRGCDRWGEPRPRSPRRGRSRPRPRAARGARPRSAGGRLREAAAPDRRPDRPRARRRPARRGARGPRPPARLAPTRRRSRSTPRSAITSTSPMR